MTTQQGGNTTIGEIILRMSGGDDAPGGSVDPAEVKQSNDTRSDKRVTDKVRERSADSLKNIDKKTGGYVKNTLGINIGIASILKQSQIFTGTLGTIFQILGALVDVILAPFMPIIVAALKSMAGNIPEIQAKAQLIVGHIVKVVMWLAGLVNFVRERLTGKFGGVIKNLLQYYLIGLFLSKIMGFNGVYMALTKMIGQQTMGALTRIYLAIIRQGAGGQVPYGPPAPRGTMMRSRMGMGAIGAVGMGVGLVGAGAATGGGTGKVMGALGGAVAGAQLGSMVAPGIGTAIGAIAGGIIGVAVASAVDRSGQASDQHKDDMAYYSSQRQLGDNKG
jgi:hypothetical protein|tara:strand:+ start:245 stop:1246 length:1002 start_codon:yes stop_codon:yes gene_type:complete